MFRRTPTLPAIMLMLAVAVVLIHLWVLEAFGA